MVFNKVLTSSQTQRLVRYVSSNTTYQSFLPADIFEGTVLTRGNVEPRRLPISKYGGRYIVTMLPGVHPGQKLMQYVKDVYKTAHAPIDFEELQGEYDTDEKINDFTKNVVAAMQRNGVGIKANIPAASMPSTNVALRTELDLFICLIHVKSYKNLKCRYPNLDMYIIRQNTEGEYAMLEHETRPGVVESLKVITRDNTERCAKWTFEFARAHNRKKVTIVHKANIMKLSDGLFLETVKEIAKEYPDIEVDDMIVDNCTMQIVQKPYMFDILITPNLYGNILSNIASGLAGGPGLMSGENYGNFCGLFEAGSRHLTFDDSNILNPIAMLNASVNLLYYLGLNDHGQRIEKAITKTLTTDMVQTADIGGTHTSDEVVECIKDNIRTNLKTRF